MLINRQIKIQQLIYVTLIRTMLEYTMMETIVITPTFSGTFDCMQFVVLVRFQSITIITATDTAHCSLSTPLHSTSFCIFCLLFLFEISRDNCCNHLRQFFPIYCILHAFILCHLPLMRPLLTVIQHMYLHQCHKVGFSFFCPQLFHQTDISVNVQIT